MSREFTLEKDSNVVTVVGKVLNVEFNTGKTSAGVPYQSAKMYVRVNQEYLGIAETSEIPVKVFATQYTSKGAPNPAWDAVNKVKALKTAQNVGIDEASIVRITKGELRDGTYISKVTGMPVTAFEVNNTFFTQGVANDNETATFAVDAVILNMTEELDRSGELTGRLVVRAGVAGYAGKLNVFDFIAESADKVDFARDNWNVNDTVRMFGRIRVASKEAERPVTEGVEMYGEDMPTVKSSYTAHELIITSQSMPFNEEISYDITDVKKAYNMRKAELEQKQADAAHGSKGGAQKKATRGWDE